MEIDPEIPPSSSGTTPAAGSATPTPAAASRHSDERRVLWSAVAALGRHADQFHEYQNITQRAIEAVTNRLKTMQQPQATPSVPTIHFREPRIFNGKPEEVVPFLKEIRHAVHLQRRGLLKDYDKAVYMATYLKDGSPASWFNSIEQFNSALLQDWDSFLDAFRERFEDPDLVTSSLHKLENLRQTSSAASYSSRFKELLVYLDFSDQTKIQYFRRNLKEPVKDLFLTVQPSTNFEDFVTQSHSENISLGIVSVSFPVILGLDWLRRHNPVIDWTRNRLALSCCGANPSNPVSALGKGFGLARISPLSSSVQSLSPTVLGLGLGLDGHTLVPLYPDSIVRSDRAQCSTTARGISYLATLVTSPLSPCRGSSIGSGQTGTLSAIWSKLCSPVATPDPPHPSLNIAFVNARRFQKYARNGETAAIWYHPIRSEGYNIAAASLNSDPPCASQLAPFSDSPDDDPLGYVPEKYRDWASVFTVKDLKDLPPHRPYDCTIDVDEGKTPPFGPLYHLSQEERAVLFDYIETNLKKGFIRRSMSPAAAPVLFVKKKTGDLRLCVDYRGLNSMTKKNRYPLPLIDDLLDRVQGCKVFSVLDLKNAFNHVRIKAGDEWKTAFRTHLGLFEYTVMPFGLTNAPSTFQAFIQDTLRDLLDVVCVVYIDDILIFSRTQEEHDRHVQLVLEHLHNAGLYANTKKCEFDKSEVEFLGYLLGADGIKMHLRKLETIADWPCLCSVKDVQSFLGFTNFYRRFIDGYAHIVLPLNSLTRENRPDPFIFGPDTIAAFEKLKRVFTSSPLLRHFNPALPSTLSTDASDFAISGILHQPDPQVFLHPVAYYSRKLSSSEINYEIYDKELLAIVDSLRDMQAWLIGTPVPIAVVSDHKNLEYFMTSRILNQHQARWSMFLSEFNFRLDYAPGLKNPADAPSRHPDYAPREGDDVLCLQQKTLLTPVHTERLFPISHPSTSSSTPPGVSHSISALSTLAINNSELLEQFKTVICDDSEWPEAIARGDQDFELQGNLVFHKAYHPRTDGLTERMNQTLEMYLRAYSSYQQDDWVDYLPLAEFAFNNHVNSSTNQTPFFANLAYHPTFEPRLSYHSTVPAAADLASCLDRLHDELCAELKEFSPGQLVWLLRCNIKTMQLSDKLDHRKLGPYPVISAVTDSDSYLLKLPSYLSRLHLVFHASLLEPYSDPSEFHPHASPEPFNLDDAANAIQAVLDCRKLGQRYEYLVHWNHLSHDEDSWIPLSDIPTTQNELFERFHCRHPRCPHPHRFIIDRVMPVPSFTDISTSLQKPSVPSLSPAEEHAEEHASVPAVTPPTPHPADEPAAHAPPVPVPRAPAIPAAAPRPSSPPPVRQNLRHIYEPPSQTTTHSGRVSRPAQCYDR
ncbi:Transposon Tf2-12 polyprotein [Sparassis crispa]|uniref:Transposon Tf2-12 polyprotein n=1 Tax=Sparassis crispa TaxID=139825 RepID=A0A401GFK8_9APHY|nr:Transposon Tf2-12 polyprotein [Sparassis crispa]GBE80968.1 Transposon Tf2-12 polyprotein [Sparassis crispa]